MFEPSNHSTRLIALKIAYLGQGYNGLEYHPNNKTPLPTVEEAIWKALTKARLLFPKPNPSLQEGEVNWDGCDFSKSGRTDKGVSAFGQVIGVRVRSNRPLCHPVDTVYTTNTAENEISASGAINNVVESAASIHDSHVNPDSPKFDAINDELPYVRILNRLLPPDIRVLAWCPFLPPDFSARFSCKERRYRYFFTQPAFTPTFGLVGFGGNFQSSKEGKHREGWLDIDAMREAAKRFEGVHDFRNFCKIDGSKQLENFERRIFHADIEEVRQSASSLTYIDRTGFQQYQDSDLCHSSPLDQGVSVCTPQLKLFTFTVHGAGFLWHQVRHMAAIIFLIGQGLESPALVDELLNIKKHPQKPTYEMADDAPLVLWDSIFPRDGQDLRKDALPWIYVGDHANLTNSLLPNGDPKGNGKYGLGGIVDDMWKQWRRRKIDEVLAGALLDLIAGQGNSQPTDQNTSETSNRSPRFQTSKSQKIFRGGNSPSFAGRYIPVLQKPMMGSIEALNARYAQKKGLEPRRNVGNEEFQRPPPKPSGQLEDQLHP